MRQIYKKPVTETHVLFETVNMIASTIQVDPESGRYADGDPTNPSGGGPGVGGTVGQDTEGSGCAYGQDDPTNPSGGGNRGKYGGGLWDDCEEE